MNENQSPLDQAAELLEAKANEISKGRVGTSSISEVSYCLDQAVVGSYPQVAPLKADGDFVDDGHLYFDRFPEPANEPIELCLQKGACRTDVLSASTQFLCFLVNVKSLEVFRQFELGNVRFYDAVVSDRQNDQFDYTCIFICNHVTLDDVDFAHSECFVVDILGVPVGEIAITDKTDFLEKDQQANDGTLPGTKDFSNIAIGKVQLLPGHAPQPDIFGMSQLDTKTYVSISLRDAILEADISGLEFQQNTRLFL